MGKLIKINLPGSKSLTNRALIIASIAKGVSFIKNYSKSDDSIYLINALEKLGVNIIKQKKQLKIYGTQGFFNPKETNIFVGKGGTTYRFLTALINFISQKINLIADEQLKKRPIEELTNALKQLNQDKIINIRGDISSQFVTALLLVSPLTKKNLIINITTPLVSKSYLDMTLDIMKKFKVKIINKNYKKFIYQNSQFYQATNYVVEPDASGASYFWAIGALTGKKIQILNIDPDSSQGDVKFVDLLKKMGAQVIKNKKKQTITVYSNKKLRGIKVNMNNMPDTSLTLAVVAAFAQGKTTITGLKTLKVKETDRLVALYNELKKIGIKSKITDDSITIFGGQPKPAIIKTYNDHRMAMAFSVAKKIIPEIKIKEPQVVNKSFPNYWVIYNKI